MKIYENGILFKQILRFKEKDRLLCIIIANCVDNISIFALKYCL